MGLTVNKEIEKAIQWTLYGAILFVILLGYFVPFIIFIISDDPPAKIVNWLGYAGTGLSLFSLVFAVYSLKISAKSQEKIELSMSDLKVISNNIKNSQDRIESRLAAMKDFGNGADGTDASAWKPDKTGPKE